jgi:general nucleoside transport system permease protein
VIDLILAALQISIPLVLAALCGAITERSGVIDLALEAKLLFGAFAAAAVSYATGSAIAGLLAGMATGAAVAALQLALALVFSAQQVIIGIALNLLAFGGTRFLLQLIFHEGTATPPCDAFEGSILVDPMFWIAVLATAVLPFALARTRWGLRLRAAGDRPESLLAVGVSPTKTRFAAGLVGGALAGAGGAQLSLAIGVFSADMSGGRGYIALVMVILARWRPALAALACVGISLADAAQTQLQLGGTVIPRELAPLLPPMLTLVVLALFPMPANAAPRSLGKS